MARPKDDAVLQIEIDMHRFKKTKENNSFHGPYGSTPYQVIYDIAKTAACDTIHLGGTLVLTSKDGVITIVQRSTVEPL